MRKDETIKDIANVLDRCCNEYDDNGKHIRNLCRQCEYWSDDNHCCCSYNKKEATALYNAGYRKIADNEIVVKKSEYKELKKYRTDWLNDEKMHLQAELEDTEFELGCSNRLFQKVCEEKKELEKQLEQYKNKAKFYYERCKSCGCENFYDAELEWWED